MSRQQAHQQYQRAVTDLRAASEALVRRDALTPDQFRELQRCVIFDLVDAFEVEQAKELLAVLSASEAQPDLPSLQSLGQKLVQAIELKRDAERWGGARAPLQPEPVDLPRLLAQAFRR